MPYNPGNMAALYLQNQQAEQERRLKAQMFNSQQNNMLMLDDKARKDQQAQQAEAEKQAQAQVKGFRAVWEASPEMQKAIPVKDWGDVAPNQVAGMIKGLATLQQQQQAQQAQAKVAQEMQAKQQAQQEEQARARALASAYGGAQGSAPMGPGGAMAPGVYSTTGNGKMATMSGGQQGQPFMPPAGTGQRGPQGSPMRPGQMAPTGPAAQYAQSLLAQGVAPNQSEIEAALKGMRVPQQIGSGANQFVMDPNGNLQRMRTPPEPGSAPQESPNGKFYVKGGEWTAIPSSMQNQSGMQKPKMDDVKGLMEDRARALQASAKLMEQVSKGNKYKGADWRKGDKISYKDQLAAQQQKISEIDQLLNLAMGGNTSSAPAATPPAAPGAATPQAKVIDLNNQQQMATLELAAKRNNVSLEVFLQGLQKQGFTLQQGSAPSPAAPPPPAPETPDPLAETRRILEEARRESRQRKGY